MSPEMHGINNDRSQSEEKYIEDNLKQYEEDYLPKLTGLEHIDYANNPGEYLAQVGEEDRNFWRHEESDSDMNSFNHVGGIVGGDYDL